jgi:hypothetical protein
MLSKFCIAKVSILTVLAIQSTTVLLVLTGIKTLAENPASRSTVRQCTEVEIKKHIEQLGKEDSAEASLMH